MAAQQVTTQAAAARLLGVTPMTVRRWMSVGLLTEPPWTRRTLQAAARSAARRREAHRSPAIGSAAEHGTVSRWRAGCDCDACRAAHNEDTTTRRAVARAAWWAQREEAFLLDLAEGMVYSDALQTHDISAQAVTARRRRDRDFAARLWDALEAGRDPNLAHGTAGAWRHGRCHCWECWEWHERTR